MTTLRVWAPKPSSVELQLGSAAAPWTPRRRLVVGGPGPREEGQDYAFVLDGGDPGPTPAAPGSRTGVHGPSRRVDHEAFAWTDQQWRGVPRWPAACCTRCTSGRSRPRARSTPPSPASTTWSTSASRAVELLPCNAFAGRPRLGLRRRRLVRRARPVRRPEGLKRFVDACHAAGLGVVMDVVYNHLGPAGNYLPEFGPYLTEAHHTPWGPAVNLDRPGSEQVRRYVLDNALMWLRDYHVDGLRIDAVHAFVDERATHLLEELSVEVEALGAQLRKPLFLIAESDLNDAGWSARARPAGSA
jgi:maltooligosyltrehalose trehalohydrolase